MREVAMVDGLTPITRAEMLFHKAFERALQDRRDSVLWAKLIVERCDGPPRADGSTADDGAAALAALYREIMRSPDNAIEDAQYTVTSP